MQSESSYLHRQRAQRGRGGHHDHLVSPDVKFNTYAVVRIEVEETRGTRRGPLGAEPRSPALASQRPGTSTAAALPAFK